MKKLPFVPPRPQSRVINSLCPVPIFWPQIDLRPPWRPPDPLKTSQYHYTRCQGWYWGSIWPFDPADQAQWAVRWLLGNVRQKFGYRNWSGPFSGITTSSFDWRLGFGIGWLETNGLFSFWWQWMQDQLKTTHQKKLRGRHKTSLMMSSSF